MNEKFIEKAQFEIAEKYINDYRQLQEIFDVIEGLGLTPTRYPAKNIQDQWDMGNTFPIANEGAQGIRITRWSKGGLTISFTNGFEDSMDPKRVEVTEKLREKGFDVV